MSDPTEARLLKRRIPIDLQTQLEDIKLKLPRVKGPPEALNDEKKRWLIVGICLHSIISPLLRKYVDPIVNILYNSLVSTDSIDTQGYHGYLTKYPATNMYYFHYESINNNKNVPKMMVNNKWINDYKNYDYKVTSHVDLSKLYLLPYMAHYTAIDESCDLSNLLGLVININSFPTAVQTDADKIRTEIRNSWAHCDFREWTVTKYTDSFHLMVQLVKDVALCSKEENRILGELNTWATNGHNFLSGNTLGLEIEVEICRWAHVLCEYVQTLCTETDSLFIKVQKELKDLENSFDERIINLKSKTNEHELKVVNIEAEQKKENGDPIPGNIRAQYRQEESVWEQDRTIFVETRATHCILESLLNNNCIIATGCAGSGKSSNIHYAALHLRDRFGYEIIPFLIEPSDIIRYYNKSKKQVFVVDDICGKETINRQTLQIWRGCSEKMENIFKMVDNKKQKISSGTFVELSDSKLLISCRLHIYKESQFQCVKILTRKECNLGSQELCLLEEEKRCIGQNYLLDDIIGDILQVTEKLDYFPLLCKLLKDKSSEEALKLCKAPMDIITEHIKLIILENKMQFCAIVLCILFDDGFNTDWLEFKLAPINQKTKIEDIVKEFEINTTKELARSFLKSCFTTLNGTFFKRRGTEYRLIHDKLYQMTAVICGRNLTECFIKHAPTVFIRDHFSFQSIADDQSSDGQIVLTEHKEDEYFERLLNDLKEWNITSTFHNNQLIYQPFIDKLISSLGRSDKTITLLQKLDTEGCEIIEGDYKRSFHTTPLIESASGGYFDLVNFLIVTVKCNVNKVDGIGRSSLYRASESGKTDVVELLLQNSADVNHYIGAETCPLYAACAKGHTETVKVLLLNDANISQNNRNGESLLYAASAAGHTDTVKVLLQNEVKVSVFNCYEESPLHVACERGHIRTVELLLLKNADVSKCDYFESSPLHVACEGGHTDIVNLLLQNKASVFKCDRIGHSALYVACKGGHTATANLLLRNNADVNQCGSCGQSPLCVASYGGHTHTVEMLIQNNADVSQFDGWKTSSLFYACAKGYTETVKVLLLNNANVFQCNTHNESPLFVACKGGHIGIVKLLLQKNANVSQCTIANEFPLFVACKGGFSDIAKMLLQNNAYISQCDGLGHSALYVACEEGHTDTAKLLLQSNANVSQCSNSEWSPLLVACEKNNTDVVTLLLQNQADVSHCDSAGQSPLHKACRGGHIDIVQLLLQNQADVSHCDSAGQSPLHKACSGGHIDIVQLLLQNQADVSHCDSAGQSPLHKACRGGHIDIAKLLIQNQADVSHCDSAGQSPLHKACRGGHIDIAKLLIQNQTDISHCDSAGQSPLHKACRGGHVDIVQLLLQNNASVSLRDNNGKCPLHVAWRGGYSEIVTIFLQNKADVSNLPVIGRSSLFQTCEGVHSSKVEQELQNTTYVSQCSSKEKHSLFIACKRNNIEKVRKLLQMKADVLQCNSNGKSPLYVCCEKGYINLAKLLLVNNANVSQCDDDGKSLLYVACRGGHTDIVKLLLQNNADVSQCEYQKGQTPLHAACDIDFLNYLKLDSSYQKRYKCHIEIVKLLIAYNADLDLCNANCCTPLEMARISDHTEIVNLLRDSLRYKTSQLDKRFHKLK